MLPQWLMVPAADGTAGQPARRAYPARSPAPDCTHQDATLVVFVADPATAIHVRAYLRWAASVGARQGLGAEGLRGVRGHPLAGVEVIDAGMLARGGSAPTTDSDHSGSDDPQRLRMCRHRLDVALSCGRHSAERAKLAGHGALICAGLDVVGAVSEPHPSGAVGSQRAPVRQDLPMAWTGDAERGRRNAYAALLEHGDFAVAAMVGAIIACAQMGILVYAHGALGALAVTFAERLRPDVREWLDCRDTRAEEQALAADRVSDTRSYRSPAVESRLDMVE